MGGMRSTRNVRWATQEFGGARIGDERRRQRLVQMAACAAASPAGKVTEVFSDGAEPILGSRQLGNEVVDGALRGVVLKGKGDKLWRRNDGAALTLRLR